MKWKDNIDLKNVLLVNNFILLCKKYVGCDSQPILESQLGQKVILYNVIVNERGDRPLMMKKKQRIWNPFTSDILLNIIDMG